jgi:hypothetical protein
VRDKHSRNMICREKGDRRGEGHFLRSEKTGARRLNQTSWEVSLTGGGFIDDRDCKSLVACAHNTFLGEALFVVHELHPCTQSPQGLFPPDPPFLCAASPNTITSAGAGTALSTLLMHLLEFSGSTTRIDPMYAKRDNSCRPSNGDEEPPAARRIAADPVLRPLRRVMPRDYRGTSFLAPLAFTLTSPGAQKRAAAARGAARRGTIGMLGIRSPSSPLAIAHVQFVLPHLERPPQTAKCRPARVVGPLIFTNLASTN